MRYGLVMIVKDEAERIRPCLESLLPHLASWTILDTGSTDGTTGLITELLEGIPGQLHHGPFENFGSARSRAFALARWTAAWLLASDADMTWSIDDDWRPADDVDAYTIDMGGVGGFSNRLPLVLRGDRAWQSRGVVHEYTCLDNGLLGRREPTDAVQISQPGAAWSEERGRWHEQLLVDELARHPADPRTIFYLAQTYRDLGDSRARGLYLQRVLIGEAGHPQEHFVAAYMAASLQPDWRLRIAELLGAWEMRPHRLEPLYDVLHELNAHRAYQSAFRLSDVALAPSPDDLFVHTAVWDWGLALERSIAAWHTNHFDEHTRLTAELEANPRLPAAQRAALLIRDEEVA